jgi:putative N6-adenine-specific DNA methylase
VAGLHVHAEPEAIYRILYESRLLTRVLAPLLVFDCHSDRYLYRTAKKLEWSALLDPDSSFMIVANVSQSRISHSLYAAQVLKDAIVDRFREETGRRPSVNTVTPDVVLNLHVRADRATVSVDLGAGSLHRRGYRIDGGEAPMQETVAAAVIRLSGWDGTTRLVDPLCGSGTLLAEAHMAHARIPAQLLRERWGLQRLPDFDRAVWDRVRERARAAIRDVAPGLVSGSDADAAVLATARSHLDRLPGGPGVALRCVPFQDLDEIEHATIVTNPPWGIRLGERDAAQTLLAQLGDFLKQRCRGSTAWLYFGDRELVKSVGLKPARRIPLRAGGLDGRLVAYELW